MRADRDGAPDYIHGRKEGPWRWEDGYEKQRVSGQFEWVEIDGSIDYSTVCQNYQRGSFNYRDCCKIAKVTFAKCAENTNLHAMRLTIICLRQSEYSVKI